MQKKIRILSLIGFVALAATLLSSQFTAADAPYANGPFTYTPGAAGSATFIGSGGDDASCYFQICAPGGAETFPPSGAGSVEAIIKVFDIQKTADASGNLLLEPITIPGGSLLFNQIKGAFTLNPNINTFTPGSCVTVEVTIANPGLSEPDYGTYLVVMKAQVRDEEPGGPGGGVGVGSGSSFLLTLNPPAQVDSKAPTVNIISPTPGDYILGPIAVNITATDPEPGTGVQTLTAKVSSAGGAVNNLAIPLTITPSLPVAAGVEVTGTGTFNPTGGTGTAGTIAGTPFTAASRSGIGQYTLTATAQDAIPNTGTALSIFTVKYDVQFTKAEGQINQGQPNNSVGRFTFTTKRSATTSDGAFMVDRTVKVELVRTSDNTVVATHTYGSGDIKDYVQIDTAVPEYKTNFRRGDLLGPPGAATAYKARVSFLDVDGTFRQQAESAPVTF